MIKKANLLLFFGIILVATSPYIFTRHLGIVNFENTGQIGDTIGGITAHIVNLIGAILVYFALKAQIDANTLIQLQLDEQKKVETQRMTKVKNLILWDLTEKIKPNALKIKKEIEDYTQSQVQTGQPFATITHVDFNTDIFIAVGLIDCFSIFNKNKCDFYDICNFYKRVDFISQNTLSTILNSLSIDKVQHSKDVIENLYSQKFGSIVGNINTLCTQIDNFYKKYNDETV